MTRTEAEALAATALPCPFCGAKLIVHHEKSNTFNPDGEFELRHAPMTRYCVIGNIRNFSVDSEYDHKSWNSRTPKEQ